MSYQKLKVYEDSYQLAIEIHRFTLSLPKYLQFDLADQLRRASRSIPSNIVEGFGRIQSKEDTLRFLRMALGSSDEVIFNLNFLKDLDLIERKSYDNFYSAYTIIGKQLYRLIGSLQSRHSLPETRHP